VYICDLYFQDPEIGSLMIFVIIVFIVIVISQHFGTSVLELCRDTLSDMGCLIVTFVKLQVFRVTSG